MSDNSLVPDSLFEKQGMSDFYDDLRKRRVVDPSGPVIGGGAGRPGPANQTNCAAIGMTYDPTAGTEPYACRDASGRLFDVQGNPYIPGTSSDTRPPVTGPTGPPIQSAPGMPDVGSWFNNALAFVMQPGLFGLPVGIWILGLGVGVWVLYRLDSGGKKSKGLF